MMTAFAVPETAMAAVRLPLDAVRPHPIAAVAAGRVVQRDDALAVEEPLEIRLCADDGEHGVTVTMRTPGADAELALGLLVAENVLDGPRDVAGYRHCGSHGNVLKVMLARGVVPRLGRLARNLAATASCGLCGKATLDAVMDGSSGGRPPAAGRTVAPAVLHGLPRALRDAQPLFERTGGLHAVAAFSFDGERLALREDIGRHNAFDKLVGAMLGGGAVDLSQCLVALSGRAGFELLQKAAAVRVPIVVAVGAPTSLAVELAARWGITLVGFLREASFNVYTHPRRLGLEAAETAATAEASVAADTVARP